jgi:hypothetical protein
MRRFTFALAMLAASIGAIAFGGPAFAGPAHAGPAHAGPAHAGPAHAGPAHAGPAHAGPAHAGPAHAGPAHAGPAPARDDDAVVCAATAKAMTDGLEAFVADMQKVGRLANGGDLAGAQAAVKDAGATMVRLAEQLDREAAQAETPRLKDVVTQLSNEFEALGKSLTDLTSLQNFDTTRLDELTNSFGEICRMTPSPGLSPTGPPTATPTASATG